MDEKKRTIEDKTRSIELEKEKIASLQKIDSEQKEMEHRNALARQRELFAEQHDSLRNQLE